MKFFVSKMMTTNLKCPLILMGSDLKICKSKFKTTLSVFKANTRRKQMKATAKAMFLDIYQRVSPCLEDAKWRLFHPTFPRMDF